MLFRSDTTSAAIFIARIKTMNKDLGIPNYIEGIKESDIPQMVDRALSEANPLYPVPVILGQADLARLFDIVRGRDSGSTGGGA